MARRDEILDAALRVFTDRGVAAATVDDVRRLSGASVGSIYHHFGGKEGLAEALQEEAIRSYQEGFLGELRRGRDPRRTIRALVSHHLRWVQSNPDLARFLLGRHERSDRIRELNRKAFAATGDWLERQVAAGRLRELPLDLFYALLLGPSQEFARHWLAGRMTTSIQAAERALGEAAWRSLAAEGV